MKNDREASARKVGSALLAALNDRDHRLLVTFRCDDVVIEVASQVSVLDPADASQAVLMGLLEGPWKQWTLAPGLVQTDGAAAIIGFSAEGPSPGVQEKREGVLAAFSPEGSFPSMAFFTEASNP